MAKMPPSEVSAQELMTRTRQKMRQNQATRKETEGSAPGPKKTRKKKIGQAVFSKPVVTGKPLAVRVSEKNILSSCRKGRGHPLSLTKEKIAAIARHMVVGNYAVTACAMEDVPERTFYHWMEVGERDLNAGLDSLHVELLQSIKKASAIAESNNVNVALKGGNGWKANMKWLQRRFPDRWGNQMKLNLEEAKIYVQRLISILARHIPDHKILTKIVEDMKGVHADK